MATPTLTLDARPGSLVIGYILGDPWSRSVDYEEKTEDGEWEASPWPAAPVLEFTGADLPDLTATLSMADSRATWVLTEEQVAAMHAAVDGGSAAKRHVRLSVGGITWFAGQVNKRG